RPEHADDVLVPNVVLDVRRALARVPLARLGRRVVARLVADDVLAGLVLERAELILDRLRHLNRLRAARALQSQARRDGEPRRPAALDKLAGARRRRQRADARPTGTAVGNHRCDKNRDRSDRTYQESSLHTPSFVARMTPSDRCAEARV